MLSAGFSRWLTVSGFERRATFVPGGGVIYALADGSGHVALDALEWQGFGDRFERDAKAVTRKANRMYLGLLPAVMVYALTVGQLIPFSGIVILLAIFGGPIAIYLWQSHRIKAIAVGIESELARRPEAPRPAIAIPRIPRWLEIAAALFVGPHLIFQAYGTLNPDAFRGTPWMGTRLDWSAAVGFAILAAIFVLRLRRPAKAGEALQPEAPVHEPVRTGRRADFVGRARETAS
jgi:hypothetical protein